MRKDIRKREWKDREEKVERVTKREGRKNRREGQAVRERVKKGSRE